MNDKQNGGPAFPAPNAAAPTAGAPGMKRVRMSVAGHSVPSEVDVWIEDDGDLFGAQRSLSFFARRSWCIAHRPTGTKVDLFFETRREAMVAAAQFNALPGFRVSRPEDLSDTTILSGQRLKERIAREQEAVR